MEAEALEAEAMEAVLGADATEVAAAVMAVVAVVSESLVIGTAISAEI